jgi:N-acetylmuramate 1-kinase
MSTPPLPVAVTEYLARRRASRARVVPLTGDASDRRYFRVLAPGAEPFVLAVYASPFDAAGFPFLDVAALFAAMPVDVPRVLDVAGDLGVVALEDLGDVTLQGQLGAASAQTREALYRQAVSVIDTIQRRGHELHDPARVPYQVAFDVERLTWEFDFFIKYFLEAYRGLVFGAGERAALRDEGVAMARELAAEPRVLCHRDFHSRNLMVRHGRLSVIDFQDARLGPDTYDLASLVFDSYVDVPPAQASALVAYFLALQGRSNEEADFRPRFDLVALQRNLKALGTFGYQTTARHNSVYIQYVPRTLRYAREHLRTHERFARLADLLAAHVPELR